MLSGRRNCKTQLSKPCARVLTTALLRQRLAGAVEAWLVGIEK